MYSLKIVFVLFFSCVLHVPFGQGLPVSDQNQDDGQQKLQQLRYTAEQLRHEALAENVRLKQQGREYLNCGLMDILANLDQVVKDLDILEERGHPQESELNSMAYRLIRLRQKLKLEIQKLENHRIGV